MSDINHLNRQLVLSSFPATKPYIYTNDPHTSIIVQIRSQVKREIFMGWFGPRGLASIVFIVMILDKDLPHKNTISSVVLLTILLSVVAHGITANPQAEWIGKERK